MERLARVLGSDAKPTPVTAAGRLPPRRQRLLEPPAVDMNMLDFLSLYGCQLQYVVGERNSIMGRVMQPLNQLRYELRFIAAARACLPEIERPELVASLQRAIRAKTEALPVNIWNAVWATEEVESLLTLSRGPVARGAEAGQRTEHTEASQSARLAGQLGELNAAVGAILGGDMSVSLDSVGDMHQSWQSIHLPGQLLVSAQLLTTRLEDASAILDSRLGDRPLCFNGKPNNQSDIARAMFLSVYAAEVQPYMARIRRLRDRLIPPLNELAGRLHAVAPDSFRQWQEAYLRVDRGVWKALDDATREHTRRWQQLLQQCGSAPERSFPRS
ncbi:DUF3080 family protein [Marinobacter sp. X15-166B]|uniref:DUF3080 family protein n=1 Tax=Marinobacter sp. X15-166B TaxID=1897620 RepID=UPI001D17560C|nr:DUF3080 family protein [Marinobacter sp. X15-166B]